MPSETDDLEQVADQELLSDASLVRQLNEVFGDGSPRRRKSHHHRGDTCPVSQPPLKVLIVADEDDCRARLRAHLAQRPAFKVLCESTTFSASTEALMTALEPDVLFAAARPDTLADIQRLIDAAPGVQTVLLASSSALAAQAFEIGAHDFLLMPLELQRLEATLDRLLERRSHRPGATRSFAALPQSPASPLARLPLATPDGFRFIDLGEIEVVSAERNYVSLQTGNDVVRVRGPLRALEQRLDPGIFMRIGRSTVVNLNAVRHATRNEDGALVFEMASGARCVSARRLSRQLRRRVLALLKPKI